ncbi:TetR/AcrR family transcriptional regulator [Paenibacillus kyungheensis]
MDRRILKTKYEIRNAFISLLKIKAFDVVTVKDITEEANINRATFYKHYEDKHDLLAKLEEDIIENIKILIDKSSPLHLQEDLINQSTFKTTITAMYTYIEKEKELIEVLISSNGNQSFLAHMQFLLEQLIKGNLQHYKQTKEAAVPKNLIVVYLASAHLGLIRHWLLKKLNYTPEEMANMISNILMNGPMEAADLIQKKSDKI